MYRTLNDQVLAFVQFDHNAADKATELRYIGIAEKSKFCASTQPTRDFTHFHDLIAPGLRAGTRRGAGYDRFLGNVGRGRPIRVAGPPGLAGRGP
jgi:hypothetical protein